MGVVTEEKARYQGTSVYEGWAVYEGYGCPHCWCKSGHQRKMRRLAKTRDAMVTDLVGGRPADAKALLEGDWAEEIEAHHQKHGLKPGFNRRALKITKRITVPEEPEVESFDEDTEPLESV